MRNNNIPHNTEDKNWWTKHGAKLEIIFCEEFENVQSDDPLKYATKSRGEGYWTVVCGLRFITIFKYGYYN